MSNLRPGESPVALPAAADADLRFVGRIRTPWPKREDCPRQGRLDGPDCRIEVDAVWAPALAGLERFATLDVLYWLDLSRRDLARQSPHSDGRLVGTFALRSPVRPNPIGLARVRLVRIEPAALVVQGLDCVDGTPLLDIKPDRCAFSSAEGEPDLAAVTPSGRAG